MDQEPLWRKKANTFSPKKKLNGNLPPGKNLEEEKLLTNGNYLTGNANDDAHNVEIQEKNHPDIEMEQLKEESDSNPESDPDNKTTRV